MRALATILVLLAGCQPAPHAVPLLATQAVTTLETHYSGSLISGPTTMAAVSKTDALIVNVKWVALAAMPVAPSTSVGSRARLIIAGNTDAPLLGSPSLTANVRLVEGAAATALASTFTPDRSAAQSPIANRTAALLTGITSVFKADVDGRRSIELRIFRGAASTRPSDGPLQCSLTTTRHDPFETSNSPAIQSETALFDVNLHAGRDVVLLLPTTFADPRAKVLAASIAVRPASGSAEDDPVIAQSEIDLKTSSQAFAERMMVSPIEISQSAGIASALRAMRLPDQQRASLVFLADQTHARLCQDVALVADNSILLQLSQKVLAASGNSPADALPALGWILDRSSFELLTALADSPEGNKLPPELTTVLTQFSGEVSRHAASLDEIAHGMSSEVDLHNRITAQNLVFLTDPSPSARVRAFDWLNSRRLAPAGYDPLGPARDRRVAIDRATTQP